MKDRFRPDHHDRPSYISPLSNSMPAMPGSLMPGSLMSPDTDMFSTPPSTPIASKDPALRPSLSRKESRPIISSLHIDQSSNNWTPGIVLEQSSPELRKQNATPVLGSTASIPLPIPDPPEVNHHHEKPMNSPCFVHSHLDKGASLTDWLRKKHHQEVDGGLGLGVAKALQNGNHHPDTNSNGHVFGMVPSPSTTASTTDSTSNDEDEDEFGASLTKQLAETAVGVREMSKQLGQCLWLLPTAWDKPLIFSCP